MYIFYEFVHRHKWLERIVEKHSLKYRNYIIQKCFKTINNKLKEQI